MNNADIAVYKLREVQNYVFDRNASPNSVNDKLEVLTQVVNKASKQINTYEEQMNRMINVLNEKGMFNTDIISAFTGLSKDEAEKLEGKLEEARKKILKK